MFRTIERRQARVLPLTNVIALTITAVPLQGEEVLTELTYKVQ